MSTKTAASMPRDGVDLAAIETELRPLSTEKLRSTFVESYGKAAEFIARAAVCVKLMEERGESLHGLPQLQLFRRVASGQLLADLVWKFIDSPARQVVERLPLPDQKRLASNPVLPVVEAAVGGGYTQRMTDLTKVSKAVVRQVIGDEGIRTPEEQIAHIASSKNRVPVAPTKSPVAEEPLTRSVTVKLTDSEWRALNINATRSGLTPALMARRGLIQSGVLKEGKGS